MTLERDTCERTRALISIALDEELSELEVKLLDAHRRACVNCDEFAREITRFTEALRCEALEPLPIRTAVPRRRRSGQRIMQVGATAAAVVVAVGLGRGLSSTIDSSTGSPSTTVSLGTAPISLSAGQAGVAEPQDWPGGLPRVKASELPRPLGQRAVEP
jgi:predicted anti-sigma-YlaC factor YlaD